MDAEKNCAMFAIWLEQEVGRQLKEQNGASTKKWVLVDKSQLPRQCFLWTEDPEKKTTWHLPYREGTGGIDPKTGMYLAAGPVNLGALRAIAGAIGGARTGKPMTIPSQIHAKIKKLLKKYKIGRFAKESLGSDDMKKEILEISLSKQFVETKLDKENHIVRNVAILRPTSLNKAFKGSKGRRYSEMALAQAAEMITGTKAYVNHATKKELEERDGVRNVLDILGYYENGHLDSNNVARGDLNYMANQAVWFEPLVEQMADKIGNSIHALGDIVFDGESKFEVVESLNKLKSVDLVTETGSTINLFESEPPEEEEDEDMEIDYANMTVAEIQEKRPDLIETITESVKGNLNQKEKVTSLEKEIVTLKESETALKKKVDDFEVAEKAKQKEARIQELIKESKLEEDYVTDAFMEALRGAKNEDSIKALIEDRKKIIEASHDGVKGMGDEKDKTKDKPKGKPIDEAKAKAEDEEFTEAVKREKAEE